MLLVCLVEPGTPLVVSSLAPLVVALEMMGEAESVVSVLVVILGRVGWGPKVGALFC